LEDRSVAVAAPGRTGASQGSPERRTYRLVSGDSHVNEPPDLWQSRVPARFRERAPRMEAFAEGDAWVLEGVDDPINFGMNACAGMEPGKVRGWLRWSEIRQGGYIARARITEMDRDDVDAEVIYPTPRLSHSIFANQDVEFHEALVRAYNDWLAEYCAYAPDRLLGVAMIPNRGVAAAVAEVERCAALPGIRGFMVGCYPNGTLAISPEDDAVWEAVQATGLPLSIHVGLVNAMPRAHTAKIIGDVRFYDAPQRMVELIFTGVFDRFPALKTVMAEVDCGWIPYFKEQVDNRYMRLERSERTPLDGLPSDYVSRHFHFTYITDAFAIRNRDLIGVERMLWSSDYPHVGADWPNSWRTIQASFLGVPAAERDLVLAGNAVRLYGLDR
jgi:predicted TIM-barrel fold metal-dependent hydrolase